MYVSAVSIASSSRCPPAGGGRRPRRPSAGRPRRTCPHTLGAGPSACGSCCSCRPSRCSFPITCLHGYVCARRTSRPRWRERNESGRRSTGQGRTIPSGCSCPTWTIWTRRRRTPAGRLTGIPEGERQRCAESGQVPAFDEQGRVETDGAAPVRPVQTLVQPAAHRGRRVGEQAQEPVACVRGDASDVRQHGAGRRRGKTPVGEQGRVTAVPRRLSQFAGVRAIPGEDAVRVQPVAPAERGRRPHQIPVRVRDEHAGQIMRIMLAHGLQRLIQRFGHGHARPYASRTGGPWPRPNPPGGMAQTTRMSTPWSRSQAAARRARSRLT